MTAAARVTTGVTTGVTETKPAVPRAEGLQLHAAGHAVTLRTPEGVELLMHVGIDTVTLKGQGFKPQVKVGDQVKADEKKFTSKAHAQFLATKQIVQVACPFSGGPINDATITEIAGVKVGFCCDKCEGKVKGEADEAKQIEMVFAKLDKGFTSQTKCPVSGAKIDATKTVEYKGKKVYFCCENCPKSFEKDPAKFEAKLPQLKEEAK